MKVTSDTAELNSEDCGEVEVKCTERSKHTTTCKHNVEVSNNVERIMEKDIHPGVSDCHSTNTSTNEEEDKK